MCRITSGTIQCYHLQTCNLRVVDSHTRKFYISTGTIPIDNNHTWACTLYKPGWPLEVYAKGEFDGITNRTTMINDGVLLVQTP